MKPEILAVAAKACSLTSQRWRDNPAEIQVFTSKSGDFMIKHGCFQQKPGAPEDESGISMDFNGFSQAIVSFDDKLISDQWLPTWCREMIAVGLSNQAMTYRFHLNHHPIWQRNSSTKCGVRKPLNSWTYSSANQFYDTSSLAHGTPIIALGPQFYFSVWHFVVTFTVDSMKKTWRCK